MNQKMKLAKLILIQIESLKEVAADKSASNFEGMVNLADEITKDAEQLALLIEKENNNNQVA